MTDKAALRALLDKVKAGEARPKDFMCLNRATQDMNDTVIPHDARMAYKGSVDAAIAFHNAVRPGWGYCICPQYARVVDPSPVYGMPSRDKDAICTENPARALLIADFESMIGDAE